MIHKILAVGDCNTLGAQMLEYRSYPELIADALDSQVINLGHTMATTREGVLLLEDNLTADVECVLIQFGLVDSYKTFRYSPYVLYYPDNFLRKQLRSFVKKFKKTCRKFGLNDLLGEVNVVDIDEYEKNIRQMIESALPRRVVLLETIPNHQQDRNAEILKYNKCLARISQDYYECSIVSLYSIFIENMAEYYLDATHANELGYGVIAEKLSQHLSIPYPAEQ